MFVRFPAALALFSFLSASAHAQAPAAPRTAADTVAQAGLPQASGTTYTAGAGLQLSGTTFSIKNGGVVNSMLGTGAVSGAKVHVPLPLTGSSSQSILSVTNSGSGPAVTGTGSSGSGGLFTSSKSDAIHATTSTSAHSALYAVNDGGGNAVHAGSSGLGDAFLLGASDYNNVPFGVYANIPGDGNGNGDGVIGVVPASQGIGVYGTSQTGVEGYSGAQYGYGLIGLVDYDSTGSDGDFATAIYGVGTGNNYAGFFQGNVHVNGTISAEAKDFKIDHPLDPENKYLVHASVESSEMEDIYSGNVVTDSSGIAVVRLPDWMEALNGDFRYQLTCIGQFAQAIVAQEIKNGQFTVETDKPGVKVSWQVTGVRHDAFAQHHPLEVEQDKPDRAKGTYLDPKSFNQPDSKGEEYSRLVRLRGRVALPAAPASSEADTRTP